MESLENIFTHYHAERTRNYDLRMASIKEFLPFAMTSNCTQYGPLLIELLYHSEQQQGRYKDLLKRGYFSHRLGMEQRQTETESRHNSTRKQYKIGEAYVGWDALAEDTNLKA